MSLKKVFSKIAFTSRICLFCWYENYDVSWVSEGLMKKGTVLQKYALILPCMIKADILTYQKIQLHFNLFFIMNTESMYF